MKSMEITNVMVHKEIKKVFSEVEKMRELTKTKKEPYIRPSMAPACSLKMFVSIANGIGAGSEWGQENFMMMDYYTSIGTLTHEIFQNWFGKTGKLLGNWSCMCKGTKKVKVHTGRTVERADRPVVYIKEILPQQFCPHCKNAMKYEEVKISESGFRGHVDGILEFTVNGKKVHFVIDFKGTNQDKLKRDNPNYPQYPDPKHVKQLSIYTYALSQYEGLNVVAWALLYTSRDTPIPKYKIIPHVMTEEDWDVAKLLFESQKKQVRILYKTLDDKKITRLLKHKLCKDYKFYRSHVESQYSKCKYADICFSAPKAMMTILKDARKHLQED